MDELHAQLDKSTSEGESELAWETYFQAVGNFTKTIFTSEIEKADRAFAAAHTAFLSAKQNITILRSKTEVADTIFEISHWNLLHKREAEIEKDLSKAKTASDFKNISERFLQLKKDTDDLVRLIDSINQAKGQLSELQLDPVSIGFFNQRDAAVKAAGKISLEAYIAGLVKYDVELQHKDTLNELKPKIDIAKEQIKDGLESEMTKFVDMREAARKSKTNLVDYVEGLTMLEQELAVLLKVKGQLLTAEVEYSQTFLELQGILGGERMSAWIKSENSERLEYSLLIPKRERCIAEFEKKKKDLLVELSDQLDQAKTQVEFESAWKKYFEEVSSLTTDFKENFIKIPEKLRAEQEAAARLKAVEAVTRRADLNEAGAFLTDAAGFMSSITAFSLDIVVPDPDTFSLGAVKSQLRTISKSLTAEKTKIAKEKERLQSAGTAQECDAIKKRCEQLKKKAERIKENATNVVGLVPKINRAIGQEATELQQLLEKEPGETSQTVVAELSNFLKMREKRAIALCKAGRYVQGLARFDEELQAISAERERWFTIEVRFKKQLKLQEQQLELEVDSLRIKRRKALIEKFKKDKEEYLSWITKMLDTTSLGMANTICEGYLKAVKDRIRKFEVECNEVNGLTFANDFYSRATGSLKESQDNIEKFSVVYSNPFLAESNQKREYNRQYQNLVAKQKGIVKNVRNAKSESDREKAKARLGQQKTEIDSFIADALPKEDLINTANRVQIKLEALKANLDSERDRAMIVFLDRRKESVLKEVNNQQKYAPMLSLFEVELDNLTASAEDNLMNKWTTQEVGYDLLLATLSASLSQDIADSTPTADHPNPLNYNARIEKRQELINGFKAQKNRLLNKLHRELDSAENQEMIKRAWTTYLDNVRRFVEQYSRENDLVDIIQPTQT